MLNLTDNQPLELTGPAGSLLVLPDDEITFKLAMLYEGQCEGLGPTHAATKFTGVPRQGENTRKPENFRRKSGLV